MSFEDEIRRRNDVAGWTDEFHEACERKPITAVERLLNEPLANVNALRHGFSALYYPCLYDRAAVAKLLLAKGIRQIQI